MTNLELKLPDDVLEHAPKNRNELIAYLSRYFDGVVDQYDGRFQKRVGGLLGAPLSRYEKSLIKDFLIDSTLGKLDEDSQLAAAELSAR